MSYANMDGVPTQTAGTSEILASDWNTYVRDNFDSIKYGHIVCESTSRPSGVAEGTMIYETDTNKVLVYSGSSWVEINDLDSTGGLSAAAYNSLKNVAQTVKTNTFSTNSASFVNITGMSVSITPSSSSSKILVFVDLAYSMAAAGYGASLKLRRNSTDIYIGDAATSRTRILTQQAGDISGRQYQSERIGCVYLDSPNTTSSTSYSLQVAGNPSYAVVVNRTSFDGSGFGRFASSITAMEVLV